MSINAILSTATSALSTNQQALRTVSTNVANVNNPDYVRREVVLSTLNVNGTALGVKVGEIRRMTADFLSSQVLSSRSSAGTFDAMNDIHERLQSLFGSPDDDNSVPSLVNQALAYPSELTLDPVSIPRRMGYLQQLNSALGSISNLSQQVLQVRGDTDNSVASDVNSANGYIQQVFDLNTQIVRAKGSDQDYSALQDQRDAALRNLSSLVSIKSYEQPNGAVTVTTDDGYALVAESRVQLSYTAAGSSSADVVYGSITAQTIDNSTGLPAGATTIFDSHVAQGELRGLLTMRDTDLPNLLEQLGQLSASFADQVNAAHNDSISVPPPNTLEGRNTGLLGGDAANFTGATTLAVVNSDGTLAHRVDLDFTAGTISLDGVSSAIPNSPGSTVDDVVGAINTALGSGTIGTATFTNGVLSIDATDPTQGIGFSQPDTGGSDRGGRSFSHFFGLNDLVQAFQPSHFDTGVSASDDAGFTAGQQITLVLKSPAGQLAKQFTYTATGTETIGDVVSSLNNSSTGLGQYMTFALDGSGHLSATNNAGYNGYSLDMQGDNTTRGGTGVSFTQMFGLGRVYQIEQARDLEVKPEIMASPQSLALAHLDIDSTTTTGDVVAAVSDSTGAEALSNLSTQSLVFGAAGDLGSVATSVGDYASLVLSNVSSNAAAVDQLDQAANSVKDEVEFRRSSTEGVNLDEELSNMVIYQQAYNASARLITVAQQLYDQLLNIINN